MFIGGVLVLKATEDLKYGEYKFTKQITLREAIETIIEGKVVQHAFTIPEGLTSEQIVDAARRGRFPRRQYPRDPERRHAAARDLQLSARHDARAGDPADAAMRIAARVQEIWDRRNADMPVRTPEALVTLASIVEKETGRPDERTRVAAVFVNRLRQRIKLQSDPTIIYGLVGGKGTLGRPIMRSEIEQPTPYNTYVIEGLPPGPIANPGRASLEATANPARTKELLLRRRRHRRARLRRELAAASAERRQAAAVRAAGSLGLGCSGSRDAIQRAGAADARPRAAGRSRPGTRSRSPRPRRSSADPRGLVTARPRR